MAVVMSLEVHQRAYRGCLTRRLLECTTSRSDLKVSFPMKNLICLTSPFLVKNDYLHRSFSTYGKEKSES